MVANFEESQMLKASANAAHYQTMSNSGKEQSDDQKMPSKDGFESVIFEGEKVVFHDPDDPNDVKPKDKVPKKVLHFSDGILEVYSSSEEEEDSKQDASQATDQTRPIVDPKTLRWVPWMLYYAWWVGSGAIGYCDYFGEKLAWALGITSPKYYYEIKEFDRMKEEEEERKKRMGIEAYGWTKDASAGDPELKVEQPKTLTPSNLDGDQENHHKKVDYTNTTRVENDPVKPEVVDFDPNPQKEEP